MKVNRHSKILKIIEENVVETQEDLADLLRKEGIVVTQATVSRDIREMKLVKVMTKDGRYKYAPYDMDSSALDDRIVNVFREAVLTVDYAMNTVCIHTISGMAQAAAFGIDSLKIGDVVGSVAGDDTIFILSRNEESAKEMVKNFKNILKRGR